ncbi:MAG: hypothetical protein Q9183_003590 [Haloplaca sp. 2 TL-2023]
MTAMVQDFSTLAWGPDELFPPQDTVSMADTILSASTPAPSMCDIKEEGDDKKPVKKRKSWGQELPTPKTNLPPRKRAKTEDEKEQRRIERVLRNRQAAQSSRERKRQEVEKLEGEKSFIETQNDRLKERLLQVEHEKFKLQQENNKLAAELAALKGGSSSNRASLAPSPNLAAQVFNQQTIKQELEESLRTPISLPSDSFSPSPSASSNSRSPSPTSLGLGFHALTTSPDMTQHPAAMLCDLQCQSGVDRSVAMTLPTTRPTTRATTPSTTSNPPASNLTTPPLSPPPDLSFFEDGLTSTDSDDDPSSLFTFDSMVDLDADGSNAILDNNEDTFDNSHDFFHDDNTLSADFSHQTPPTSPALQPCLGAPSSGRDGSGNAS